MDKVKLETEEASVKCVETPDEVIACIFNANEEGDEFTAMTYASEDENGLKRISVETDNARIVDLSDNLFHAEIKELTEEEEEYLTEKTREVLEEEHPNPFRKS